MRYFSPTLWREIKFAAVKDQIQAANEEDILLSYYVLSFFFMYTALWVRPFKRAYLVFTCLQLVITISVDFAINLCTFNVSSDTNIFRGVYIIYFVFFNYIASMWVHHCAFQFPMRMPMTEEERATATKWQRFFRSRFFLNRFTLGAGRWHTHIATDSWKIAVLWRLSVPLFVSLIMLGTGEGFTHPNVLLFGTVAGLAGVVTVICRNEPAKPEDIVSSDTLVGETQSLLEKEKLLEV